MKLWFSFCVCFITTVAYSASYEVRHGKDLVPHSSAVSPDDNDARTVLNGKELRPLREAHKHSGTSSADAMGVLWKKVDSGEVDGTTLPDKALDNLFLHGPSVARRWVDKERERREVASLDSMIDRRNSRQFGARASSTGVEDEEAAIAAELGVPEDAIDYDAPSAAVDLEGDMTWAMSDEALEAGVEFPEVVEFFLLCMAKPWQQGVGIQRMTYTNPPQPAQKETKSIFYRPILMSADVLRNDPLIARKTIKAVGRGFLPKLKDWTPIGGDVPPIINILSDEVKARKEALVALYKKDPNDWTDVAEEFWKKHNRDERHQPATLFEEAAHRWFFKKKAPREKGSKKVGIKAFEPIAWYVALAGGTTANHHDTASYKSTFTTDEAYTPGGIRHLYGAAVFNNLNRYFHSLLQKIFIDTHESKDAGSPQEKAFASAMRDAFSKAPGAILSIWQLRNTADKAIEKIYKKDARVSVEEDHQPGADESAWQKVEVKEETALTFTPEKPKQSQKRQYPDTLKFFTNAKNSKASKWQRALALVRQGKGWAVLPFDLDAAYDPLLMRKIIKHAGVYIMAPEIFTEEGAPPIRPSDISNAIRSYKAMKKEFIKNRRKWSKRVYEIWDAHKADSHRLPQTYLEEAVYRWYFKSNGPLFQRKNALGITKKMPEEAFKPLALYAALNGATVTSNDSIKLYRQPMEDLKTDRYQRPRAPYLHMIEHFLKSRYGKLLDALGDDLESTLSEEQEAFGAGVKSALDNHFSRIPTMGLLYLRMLVADQVTAHYSQPPKKVQKLRRDAENALRG